MTLRLKNILVGFLVSFIGSIPLGYLNIIGFDVFTTSGKSATIFYLFGVITVEFFVILGTLLFAKKLYQNLKLLKFIDAFSIVFMFILAYIFFVSSNSNSTETTGFSKFSNYFYLTGILYSLLNFVQIPFWLSWNLYLLNGNFITTEKAQKYFYVFGTILGTFSGMLVLILSLNYLSDNIDFLSKYLMNSIIPAVFLALGIFQAIKFYRKYYK